MNSIAPSCLLGGIPGRSADSHEIDLSLEFHEHDQNPDPIAIFLDRAKCFDMLVPDFAVQIACDIGLPLNVARALTGFLSGPNQDIQDWTILWAEGVFQKQCHSRLFYVNFNGKCVSIPLWPGPWPTSFIMSPLRPLLMMQKYGVPSTMLMKLLERLNLCGNLIKTLVNNSTPRKLKSWLEGSSKESCWSRKSNSQFRFLPRLNH